MRPDPPLYPSDHAHRVAVQEAERWGEAVLQPVPRRLSWWAFGRDRGELVDRVDELVATGTLGGQQLNAADYQIATSVRLLMCFDDLRATIERRPAGPYANRIAPDFPGHVGPVIPHNWRNAL